jgi:hypothetical protein
LIQDSLLREGAAWNLNGYAANPVTIGCADNTIRPKRKFLRVGRQNNWGLYRLLCRFQAQQCKASLSNLHCENIIELTV